MRKTVLVYGINYAPEPIGIGRYTSDICRYLASRGHKVVIVTTPPHYPGWRLRDGYKNWFQIEDSCDVRIIRCPLLLRMGGERIARVVAPLSFMFTSSLVALYLIAKLRPNAMLCVEPTLMNSPLALCMCKIFKIRSVLHVQDLEVEAAFATGYLSSSGLIFRFAKFFSKSVTSRFDHIITISAKMKTKISQYNIDENKISIIRNWVNTKNAILIGEAVNYRTVLGIEQHQIVVLYSGNIGRKQGLQFLLDAAAEMESDRRFIFVVAGEGPEKELLCKKYGNLHNVRFSPLVPENELSNFLQFANLHIIPQLQGTADLVLPSKIGAILRSGRPVIITSDPGTEMQTFLSNVAQFVPVGDTIKLIAAIEEHVDLRYDPHPAMLLAQTISEDKLLPLFEKILLGI